MREVSCGEALGGIEGWPPTVGRGHPCAPATGVVRSEFGGQELPLVLDEWVELRLEIDLDADTKSVYYDDQLLVSESWSCDGCGGQGGGLPTVGAVELVRAAETRSRGSAQRALGASARACATAPPLRVLPSRGAARGAGHGA